MCRGVPQGGAAAERRESSARLAERNSGPDGEKASWPVLGNLNLAQRAVGPGGGCKQEDCLLQEAGVREQVGGRGEPSGASATDRLRGDGSRRQGVVKVARRQPQ